MLWRRGRCRWLLGVEEGEGEERSQQGVVEGGHRRPLVVAEGEECHNLQEGEVVVGDRNQLGREGVGDRILQEVEEEEEEQRQARRRDRLMLPSS